MRLLGLEPCLSGATPLCCCLCSRCAPTSAHATCVIVPHEMAMLPRRGQVPRLMLIMRRLSSATSSRWVHSSRASCTWKPGRGRDGGDQMDQHMPSMTPSCPPPPPPPPLQTSTPRRGDTHRLPPRTCVSMGQSSLTDCSQRHWLSCRLSSEGLRSTAWRSASQSPSLRTRSSGQPGRGGGGGGGWLG